MQVPSYFARIQKHFLQHTHKNQKRSNTFLEPVNDFKATHVCVCVRVFGGCAGLANKIKLLIYRWHERQEQKEAEQEQGPAEFFGQWEATGN